MKVLELDLGARVEEPANVLVDGVAGTGAGQAERRTAIECVVDAEVELEVLPRFEAQPEIVIQHIRIEDDRELVRQRLVALLDLPPAGDPRVAAARRAMASALF